MNDLQHKLPFPLFIASILAALVIVVDFMLPGSIIQAKIINVNRERQQYYNAARNYHYSYKVITKEHQFSVAEDFAKLAQNHEKIEYSVSRIFKEVNWYRLLSSENKSFYSLRIASGLVLPLLIIISMLLAYRYKTNIGTWHVVLQVLLIADLVFLVV